MNGFKQFILRGNVVELAVGVVIGAAFNSVVSSFVSSFLTPFIALLSGNKNFSELAFTVGRTNFQYGNFVNAIISFLIVASVIYFLVVLPMNKLKELIEKDKGTTSPTTKKCAFCFTEIPLKAQRCPHCTSQLKGN